MTDNWKAFDEAVARLRAFCATGEHYVSAREEAHCVLDLLAGMGIMTKAIQDKQHATVLCLPEKEDDFYLSRWYDSFPESVLAEVTNKRFKKWRKEQL